VGSNPVQTVAIVAAAMSLAVALVLVLRARPRAGVLVWTIAMFFVPIWVQVNAFGVTVSAITAVTALAVVAGGWRDARWTSIDTVIVVFVATLLLARVLGHSESGHLRQILFMWIIPYIWGRVILQRVPESWIAACISAAALIVAVLAIGEFVTGVNLFLSIPGAQSSVWGGLRERAGLMRVEAGFGNSIALGGALAISTSFVVITKWPTWLRAVVLVVIGSATVLTFSRLGILGYALTLVLAVFLLRKQAGSALRWIVVGVLVVALAGIFPVLLRIFGEAGAEAEGSADYRVDLVSLLNSMVFVGISPDHQVLATGVEYWGQFRSIDSALILLGLQFGLVPLAVTIVLIISLVVGVCRAPSAANVALLAQIPAFATVALITQYAAFVWFVAGLAVATYALERRRPATAGADTASIAHRSLEGSSLF